MNIPFSKVTTNQEEIDAVARVISSGWLAAGPETAAFEREFAEYVGAKHAIFTNSCTSALKMAYKMASEYNDEKIESFDAISYPINTFCATYSAAEEMGVKTFPRSGNEVEGKGYWTAKVNVHYGGVKDETPCLIEDSAHRIEPNDAFVGNIKCYSFYATKNMTTGSGGMFVTDDDAIYERARLFWKDGLTTSTQDRANGIPEYQVVAMAGGYDGNDVAAAMGRVQLRKLPEFTKRRNAIVTRYNAALDQEWTGNHLYPYMLESVEEVYPFIAYMKERGISCGYHYPNTGWKGVSLPIYPLLTNEEVDYIIDAVRGYRATGI